MKKLILLVILITPLLTFSQTDNFIKIVGIARHQVEAEKMRVSITLTEIKRDEYQKIREKSIDEIKAELDANLKSIGYSINDLEEVWPPKKNYNKTETINYFLSIKSLDDAKAISKFPIKGFQSSNFEYIYPETVEFDDLELSKQALKDAKRKAMALAEHVNKKVGDIISINDQTNNVKKYSSPKKKASESYNYQLIVTYELLD